MNECRMVRKGTLLFAFIILIHQAWADEGMWLLPLLGEMNIEEMQLMGCELESGEIYSNEAPSLKDAIGSLDGGSCTAGLISHEGLIITNHHCGEDDIQAHSTLEHDYLTDGFWAKTKEEELPNPGKTISFVVRMENVTDRVLGMVHYEMTETERTKEIESVSKDIIREATGGNHYEGHVIPFFEGNVYYLVVLETFRDVRLVAAPPLTIGSFGGGTDNWEWPRHTADFCLMRVYTGPDGEPAGYSPENIPYRPDKILPVSTGGFGEKDFTMVMGFPGTTYRYITAAKVKEIAEIENANRIRIRRVALEQMEDDMQEDPEIRIKYTAVHSRLDNYYKYSIGQNRYIRLLNVTERRKAQEEEFGSWLETQPDTAGKFEDVVAEINVVMSEIREMENALSYIEEVFLNNAIEIYGLAIHAFDLYFNDMGYTTAKGSREDMIEELRGDGREFFRDFNLSTDKKIARSLLDQYAGNVDPVYFPGIYGTINSKFRSDVDRYLDHLYRKSFFADSTKFSRFLENPLHRKLIKDPVFVDAFGISSTYYGIIAEYESLEDRYVAAQRKYIEGLMEMYPDSLFYPDANSSLRLSYGIIEGYRPRDGVEYGYYTTLEGVLEKDNPELRDYRVPEKLKELYRSEEYLPYTTDSVMKVCFLTNLDTSGGNSGSPVLNAKGEIIGLNFDGNWESMSSDIIYEPELTRSICVDIRYVLFLIDKYGDSGYLIKEMELHD